MATIYGVNATKRLVNVPSDKLKANAQGGVLRIAYDEYAIAADRASGDILVLGRLPAGAKVVGVQLAFDDLDASGGTLDVGVYYDSSSLTDDPDALLADVSVTSAGIVDWGDTAEVTAFGYEALGDGDICVTFDGDTDATSGNIKLAVFYVVA